MFRFFSTQDILTPTSGLLIIHFVPNNIDIYKRMHLIKKFVIFKKW